MTGPDGPTRPESPRIFYDHASALARRYPDVPLPREGQPYPDELAGRTADALEDRRGECSARLIDEYFATPSRQRDIAQLYHDAVGISVLPYPSRATARAVGRVDPQQARSDGRYLVRTATNRGPAVLGMVMLAEVAVAEDIPMIRTMGLLSNDFGALAAKALIRLPDAAANLLWLADRCKGWGRVAVVQAICDVGDPAVEPWLLREPCDGDFLNGYFAAAVADAAAVHEAVAAPDVDVRIIEHTGRLLATLAWSQGMGRTIVDYAHAERVLTDFVAHASRSTPNLSLYRSAWVLARFLDGQGDLPVPDWASAAALRMRYRTLVTAPSWRAVLAAAARSDQSRERSWANRVLGELDLLPEG